MVGASGAGKSTLVDVLLRFLDIEAGVMTLNGVDVRTLDGDDVRKVIGCCEQEPHLFDSTIRANLLLARPDATDSQLADVVARARLADWIASLPDGLDTRVGEDGAAVSGGELRRIALARALLADFPVLLLDEPTEGLDAETADALGRRPDGGDGRAHRAAGHPSGGVAGQRRRGAHAQVGTPARPSGERLSTRSGGVSRRQR